VTYWFRLRETMWHWLHERLLWRALLASIGADDRSLAFVIPADEAAFHDVASRLGTVRLVGDRKPADVPTGLQHRVVRRLARLRDRSLRDMRHVVPGPSATRPVPGAAPPTEGSPEREELLSRRVAAALDRTEPTVVVLTNPATHQPMAAADGARLDPNLASVVSSLEAAGFAVIVMAMGLDPTRDNDWDLLSTDERSIPQSLLRTRWGRPEDDAAKTGAVATITAAIESARGTPLDLDGIDLSEAAVIELQHHAKRVAGLEALERARVRRFLAEVAPAAVVLSHEGHRTAWLAAGQDAGIPVFAVQHGVLYPTHPGYPDRRHPALPLPTKTFVFGSDERDVLLARGAYLEHEIEISGSPRLDLDDASVGTGGDADAERTLVRAELGVDQEDRMLVVSTVAVPYVQRAHHAPMIERVLGGALPGIHLVFKQRSGEKTEGPYRDLLTGLARAAGYAVPKISVVRDVDLYRLLRAADAHIGMHSTVLTDAVVAGTPNLLATVDAHADILGYVVAGVARPVASLADVLHAVESPVPTDPAARRAFLDRHFRRGRAGDRIATTVRSVVEARSAGGVAAT
jgi:hypothetical protein